MKGKWKVTSQRINGEKLFAVYRLRNVDELDHSGNREYASGYMDDKEKAEKWANELNGSEDAKEFYEDPDAHEHQYSAAGECEICGKIRYGSALYREIYGSE